MFLPSADVRANLGVVQHMVQHMALGILDSVFEPKITLGEMIQITLTLLAIAGSGAWSLRHFYFRRQPLWIRRRIGSIDYKDIHLPLGETDVRLILRTRVKRNSFAYQIELLEREWASWFLKGRPAQTDAIVLSRLRITVANDITSGPYGEAGLLLRGSGRGLMACAEGIMAVIDVQANCTGPWRGELSIEAAAEGEVTRRGFISVVVQ